MSSRRPSRCSTRPASSRRLASFWSSASDADGVLADEVPDPVEIDLGERARLGSPRQHLLELVELAEALEHVRRLGHAESLAAAERHSPVPLLAREGRSEVARQPIDLPREIHVAEKLVHERLQLGPLSGAHRRQHRRGCRHPLRELLEKLVEVLRVTGEQVAVLPHELLEARVERLPLAPLLHHPVEGVEGVADVLALLGTRRGRRPGQLVEIGLHDLLAQALEELLEVLPRFGRGELVALQPVHAAGEILREQPELRPSLADGVLGHLAGAARRPSSRASCSSWSSSRCS